MYTNTEKLASIVVHWLMPMSDSLFDVLLKDKLNGVNEWARRTFPVGANYSITKDIGFLFQPTINAVVTPMVKDVISKSGVSDEDIPSWARAVIAEMRKKAETDGSVTLMESLIFRKDDIDSLKNLVDRNLPCADNTNYSII